MNQTGTQRRGLPPYDWRNQVNCECFTGCFQPESRFEDEETVCAGDPARSESQLSFGGVNIRLQLKTIALLIRCSVPSRISSLAPPPTRLNLKRKATTWEAEPDPPKKLRPSDQKHLDTFFARYPLFQYDRAAPAPAQFSAMCSVYFPRPKTESVLKMRAERSIPPDPRRAAAYAEFRKAMALAFGDTGGIAGIVLPPLDLKQEATVWKDEPHPAKKSKIQNHLEKFFADYPRFRYDPALPVSAQYNAMCRLYFPGRGPIKTERGANADPQRTAAYAKFRKAMVLTFNDIYGTDVNDLGNWQSLCRLLELDPIPQTLWACRTAVGSVHVNLVDLVDAGESGDGASIRKFESEEDLGFYTRATRKYFPREDADLEQGGLLKFLLRHVR
ncbi:hypothetical protein C8R44DRAFT_252444 [Mycena epipterygia]|nr:hypothetical protein C8R44DRAFT_252444 [Mycena epipterygia]